MQALLNKVQQRTAAEDRAPQLEYWLQDVGLTQDDKGNLTLLCPNRFAMRWLQERYGDPLVRAFEEETGRQVALSFQVREPGEPPRSDRPTERGEVVAPLALLPSPQSPNLPASPDGEGLPVSDSMPTLTPPAPSDFTISPTSSTHASFRLSAFVVGSSNRLAWSAAQEICKGVRDHYNPFLVLAPPGLGKTHLGRAMGRRLEANDGNCRVIYSTAEQFFSEMILHMKDRSIQKFKDRYRVSCDALILDDLQFVLGKQTLQAELCYTIDVLLDRKKQVILLGDLRSTDTQEMSQSFRSRIFAGLSVSVEPPDYATRLGILTALRETSRLPVPMPVLSTLARLVRSNVRELVGAFHRLAAVNRLLQHCPDPEGLESLIKEYTCRPSRCILTLEMIRNHVAHSFGLAPEEISTRSRHRKVLLPRQIAMHLSRKYTCEPLHAIGRLYHRDHSSVLYAVRSLEKNLSRNPRLQRQLLFIEERLLETA